MQRYSHRFYAVSLSIILTVVGAVSSGQTCSALFSKFEIASTHLTLAAQRSPDIRQAYGNCYVESVIGLVQDHVLDSSPDTYLPYFVSHVQTNAVILRSRVDSFLSKPKEERTAREALSLIDGGSPFDTIEALRGQTLPLFALGGRHAYDDTKEFLKRAHSALGDAAHSNLKPSIVKPALDEFFDQQIRLDRENKYNEPVSYVVDEITYGHELKTAEDLKNLVDRAGHAIILLNGSEIPGGPLNHAARIGGYTLDSHGNVSGVVVVDSNPHPLIGGPKLGVTHSGLWTLSLAELNQRYARIIEIHIKGHYVLTGSPSPSMSKSINQLLSRPPQ